MFADGHGHTGCAVIGAGAVVGDATAKLGEQEQRDVVAGIVVAQVGEEGVDGVGHVGPQGGVGLRLVGVGVKAVVGRRGVEDASTEIGQVGLGDVLHVLADDGVGVLNVGGVHVGGGGQDVGALESVGTGGVDVVHDRAGSDGRGIHSAEDFQCVVALGITVNAGEQAVGLEVADGGNGHAFHHQGAREAAAEVNGGKHVLGVGVHQLGGAAQPALGADDFGLAGVPDVHAAEVRVAGGRVTDADEDSELSGFPVLHQGSHGRVEAQLVVDGQNLVFRHTDGRAEVAVVAVVAGDDGVQAVVAAGQREDCQDGIFRGRYHLLLLIAL